MPVISEISEHHQVREAIAKKTPLVAHAPKVRPSREITKLAHKIAGAEPPKDTLRDKLDDFFSRKIVISFE